MVLAVSVAQAGEEKKKDLPEGQAQLIIPVEGMTCDSCAKKIEAAISKIEGVVSVEACHESAKVDVVYEKGKVTEKDIMAAIDESGYKAKPGDCTG
jgi:copper ion binding protein